MVFWENAKVISVIKKKLNNAQIAEFVSKFYLLKLVF